MFFFFIRGGMVPIDFLPFIFTIQAAAAGAAEIQAGM